MKKSNKILIGILTFVLTCFIGYALFSETVVVNGTLNASGSFSFKASCMNELDESNLRYLKESGSSLSLIEGGYENEYCNVSGDSVSFGANLKFPSATKFFTVYLENTGTIDAVFDPDKVDLTVTNCFDMNKDGIAQETCDTGNNMFAIVNAVSIIHNSNQCLIANDECSEYELSEDTWKIPAGAKLGLLTVAYWHPDLDEDKFNGNLLEMKSVVQFNLEQVTN